MVEEFFAQGDREKREGLEISPQCNRDLSIGLPNMQLGFLEAIVTPLGTSTHSLTYLLTHLLTHLLTYSLTHLLTYSLTHSLTYSLTYSHSLSYLM